MKLIIKQCKYCPLMPDCDYREKLRSEVRRALMNVTVNHNCPVYRSIFKERDEVLATPVVLITEKDGVSTYEYVKSEESYKGVVIHTPQNGRKNLYAVAFFEPIGLWDGQDIIDKYVLGMKASQLQKIGEYEGNAFWESGKYFS